MKTILILLTLCAVNPRWEYSPEELADIRLTTQRWRELATQEVPGENLAQYLDKLGQALRGSSSSKGKPPSDRLSVHFLVRDKLLAIPGHAEHFRDRINASRAAMEAAINAPNSAAILGPAVSDMVHEQRSSFQTLRELPSPETVRVLGDFLSDDRGAELSEERKEETGQSPNSRYAVSAMSKLGIANPPTPPVRHSGDVTDGMESWRQWYAEVKSGRRTFRFIGDPVDYTLRGPSMRGAVEPGPRDRKRSAETPPGDKTANLPSPPAKPRFLAYLIGVAFVLGGYLFYRRGKRNGA